MQHFHVIRWAAWANGLETQADWRAWLAAPRPLAEGGQPALADMPAMMRRRMDPLGRAALQAAYWAQGEQAGRAPVVFASRWGEIARSLLLLQQLADGEALSPTHFSLSVHNASSALYSMARQDRSNYLAVAAGPCSAEAGVTEALGLLADGAPEVLLVVFDAPLPPAYAAQGDALGAGQQDAMLHAWACLLGPAQPAQGLSLRALPPEPTMPAAPGLPGGLAVLDFLSGAAPQLRRTSPQGSWLWERHHAG